MNAAQDRTLGRAEAITLRLTFTARSNLEELRLKRICPNPPEDGSTWAKLTQTFRSYHEDIVIPFASAGERPLIMQCEPFRPVGTAGCEIEPLPITIRYPARFEMEWEGESCVTEFSDPGKPLWTQPAHLVDSIIVYESGYIGYSAAIIFGKEPRTLGAARTSDTELNAAALLAITSLARTAGKLKKGSSPVTYAFRTSPGRIQAPAPADKFFTARIKQLASKADNTAFAALMSASPENKLLVDKFTDLQFPDPAQPATLSDSRCSVSLEVIGATRHRSIQRAARQAAQRIAPVNDFTRRLAGLVQNVIDFHEQDAIEVHDSLAIGHCLGDEQTFVHQNLAIRFSTSSRAYNDMWAKSGGEPYWFLVELVISHNSKLLIDLNDEVRDEPDPDFRDPQQVERWLFNAQRRRSRLGYYIPNVFRYPTEQTLYENFVRGRGLNLQMQYFERLETTLEQRVREQDVLNSERSDRRRDRRLMAIGVAQVIGVGAGFASLFTALSNVQLEEAEGLRRSFGLAALEARVPSFLSLKCLSDWLGWLKPQETRLPCVLSLKCFFEPWLKPRGTYPFGNWGLLLSFSALWTSMSFAMAVALTYFLYQSSYWRHAMWSLLVVALVPFATGVWELAFNQPLGFSFICVAVGLTIPPVFALWEGRRRDARRT